MAEWKLLSDGSVEMPDGNIIVRGAGIVVSPTGKLVSTQISAIGAPPKIAEYIEKILNQPFDGVTQAPDGTITNIPSPIWDVLWGNLTTALQIGGIPTQQVSKVIDAAFKEQATNQEVFNDPTKSFQQIVAINSPQVAQSFPTPVAQVTPQATPAPASTPLPSAAAQPPPTPSSAAPPPQAAPQPTTPPSDQPPTPDQVSLGQLLLGQNPNAAGQGTTGPSPSTAPGVQQLLDATNQTATPAIAGAPSPLQPIIDFSASQPQINMGNPSYSEYAAYSEQMILAGGQPISFQDWQARAYRTTLQSSLLVYYNGLYQNAFGRRMDLKTKNAVLGAINGMDETTLLRLGSQNQATYGDPQILADSYPELFTQADQTAIIIGPPDPSDPNWKDPKSPAYAGLTQAKANYDQAVKDRQTAQAAALKDQITMLQFINPAFADAAGITSTGAPKLSPQQAALEGRQQSIASTIQATLGRPATQAEINTYANAPDQTFQDFLANAPYKNGQSLSEYGKTESDMNAIYQKYYGRNATPQEIAWGAFQGSDAIQTHLMQGESRINGINLGTYLNYSSALNPISEDLYGTAADDHIISQFHQALQSMGKDFTPTYNPRGGA